MKFILWLLSIIYIINVKTINALTVNYVKSNQNIISVNNHKYRESLSYYNNSQFVFNSNKNFKINGNLTRYTNYKLLEKHKRWNIEINKYMVLFKYDIVTNQNNGFLYYCHNINLKNNNNNVKIIVRVNNKNYWTGPDKSNILLKIPIEYLMAIETIIETNGIVELKSSIDNGYTYNADSWIWYKNKNILKQYTSNNINSNKRGNNLINMWVLLVKWMIR